MNIFNKFKFLLRRPKVIIVCGEGKDCAKEAIYQVLKPYFELGKEILIFAPDLTNYPPGEKFKFLMEKSSLPVLVITHVGDIPYDPVRSFRNQRVKSFTSDGDLKHGTSNGVDKNFFAGEQEKTREIRKLAKSLPSHGYLILNFDDETVREIKDETNLKEITFGFQEGADFRATDIKLNSGTNFKINYKGNVVPVWLEKLFGKEQIYSALAAAVCGTIFDLNLVEISQALKNYYSLPGKMRLISGIKNSSILDDSESATVFSMVEAIEILGEVQGFKRKIAVLGDIIGIGKYTIEAHEAIGERVAKNTDLLFTFGQRAKFIGQGAQSKGMALEKIFQFNTIEEGKLKLQDEIKEGDLVLVDGSKEMEMAKIVEEISVIK